MAPEKLNTRVHELTRQHAKQQNGEEKDGKEKSVGKDVKRKNVCVDIDIPVYVPKPHHQWDKRLKRKEVSSGYTSPPCVTPKTPATPSNKKISKKHTARPGTPHPSPKPAKTAVPDGKKSSTKNTRSITAEAQHAYVQITPYGPVARSQLIKDYNEEECAEVRGAVREGGYGGFLGVDWYLVRRNGG
jgi:hypothetical protein